MKPPSPATVAAAVRLASPVTVRWSARARMSPPPVAPEASSVPETVTVSPSSTIVPPSWWADETEMWPPALMTWSTTTPAARALSWTRPPSARIEP